MADGGRLEVAVISPERTIYEGRADAVVAPAWDGEVGILRGHAPMVALLGTGDLRVRRGDREERFLVAGGFLQVADDVVTILDALGQSTYFSWSSAGERSCAISCATRRATTSVSVSVSQARPSASSAARSSR